MCGIIGYVGTKNAVPALIDGLKRLEYRGYDSAGIALINDKKLTVTKEKGRIINLEKSVTDNNAYGVVGIGHTRWATHGVPSRENSHPHTNEDKTIAIIHNGIFENYKEQKDILIKKGYTFASETDSEVLAFLISDLKKSGLSTLEAMVEIVRIVHGSYALGVVSVDDPDTIYCARKESPLLIGLGENENYLASDVPAILDKTREVIYLDNLEIGKITKDKVEVFNKDGVPVNKKSKTIMWNLESAEKDGFDYFMEKEIHEQPSVIAKTIAGKLKDNEVSLDEITLDKTDLDNINRVYIVACGTAYYAGSMGKVAIEKLAKIPVVIDVASEFRYSNPIVDDKTLLIVISQSGETADTLAALRMCKEKGAKTIAVVNVMGSSVAREADNVFYTLAGPEIAVASTKAYTAQVVALYLIALKFALTKGCLPLDTYTQHKNELQELPEKFKEVLNSSDKIKSIVNKYYDFNNVFYIGRGLDYNASLEGALKLKEVSYMHAEAYPAGELKHGPIALLTEKSLIFGIATQTDLLDKTISNLQECKARGAKLLGVSYDTEQSLKDMSDDFVAIPDNGLLTSPLIANAVQQLFALHMTIKLGLDVDKPRNLAKSVTVE